MMEKTYSRGSSYEPSNGQRLAMDDFDHILDGVYIFKKAFGDLDIPVKFEVPAHEPWPSHLHGLRLGKRLEKLLSSPDFFSKYPEKVKELSKLGLDPSVDSLVDDWTLIIRSLETYKEINGNLRVPSKFEVPSEAPWPRLVHGHKLGVRVAAMRSAGRYVKDHPDRKEKLDSLGFEWRLRDHTHKQQVGEQEFDDVYEALTLYKGIYGDLKVPNNFKVPQDDALWPTKTHGMNLGNIVHSIRSADKLVYGSPEREKALTDLGFVWEETGRALYAKKRFELIFQALEVYKTLHGDLLVPQAFVVPKDTSDWPEELWDLKLGARVNAMRSQGTLVSNSPDRRARLDEIGFTWELPLALRRRKKNDLAMLQAQQLQAKQIQGSGEGSDPNEIGTTTGMWATPEEAEDAKERINSLSLPGRIVGNYKSAISYDPTRMFEPVGYREVAAEAMRDYLLEREYSADPDVRDLAHFEGSLSPETYHKIITRQISDEDIDFMKKVGYRILEFGEHNWDSFMECLHTYKDYYGDLNVPEDYIITEDTILSGPNFDPKFEDFKLGDAVLGVRIGDIDGLEDPPRKKVLEAIGFEWGDKSKHLRFRFLPLILGLKIYRHLYGFALVQSDFTVPDEPQWPYWMANMPLGEWTDIARIQQRLLEDEYPERYGMLQSLEFIFWLPPGDIPQKYFRSIR